MGDNRIGMEQIICVSARTLNNNQDALLRNRQISRKGEQQPLSKLTWAVVQEIRSSSETISKLARRFGVSRRAISLVKDGKTWQQ